MITEQAKELPCVSILGTRIHSVRLPEVLTLLEGFVQDRTPRLVVTADATALVIAHEDPEFHQIINAADLVTPDGIGLIWAAQRQGTPFLERVPGVDLVKYLVRLSHERGYRLFFLGAAPGVAEEAARNLTCQFPNAKIAGIQHGYFNEEQEPAILEQIREAQPDILLVAMGMPKQEKWLAKHKQTLQVPVNIGIGGSFDVYSGRIRRAPRLFQKLGLEWLWRLAQDPRKIGKVKNLPRFIGLVLKARSRE
jgi:N-acetylglucosaminyldiphosphoundecaprenol N-acetyl-beta-D-mannosaminyltransferase